MTFFRWLVDRTRQPPAWLSRDARCLRCNIPRQAHTREFHAFVPPEPKKKPAAGS